MTVVRTALALLCAFALAVTAAPASAAVTSVLAGTTLTLTGDGSDDTVALGAAGTDITVDLNADGVADATFPLVAAVTVDAGGGDDVVSASAAVNVPVTINGGDGADTLTGGTGADTISGGNGPDVIAGARGSDMLSGDAGADRFTWNPGDGSDTLEGGAGSDLSVFNGANVSEKMTLSPNGARARFTRDIGAIVQDMGGIESLDVRTLGGTDTFTSGAGVAAVLPTVRVVSSGPFLDTLIGGDEVDELIGGPGPGDVIDAGAGDDVIPLGLSDGGDTIDAGPGTDTLAVTGSDASETYSIGVPAVAAASVTESTSGAFLSSLNTERVRIEALGGNDTVTMQGPAATALTADLRGGDGDDALTGGAGPDILRGGDGADRLDGADGNDQLFGDAGDDLLLGRAGADIFACGGLGDTLDATAEDTVGADCVPPVPPVTAAASTPAAVPIADTTAPSVTLRGLPAKTTRAVLLKRGLSFTVTASEASALEADLLVRARSAVISAASPNLSVAKQTLRAATGSRRLTLRPARKLLGRAKRFTLTVRVVATDAAGNRRVVTRSVRVSG